ncbi:peptidoglycan bridge formation glycyltransferase FemA/FemB family protein [Patescibacteria group bacterium]|nr:peptidoglycan bridge formation glycyltransferase FemA/FemB family protein [Patescibacteria group bacterium]
MEIKEIKDKKIWDSAVDKFEYSTMFLSWEWGVFERSVGHSFENWGVYDGDNVIGLLTTKIIKARRGKYVHLRHTPLIKWEDGDVVNLIRDFIIKKVKNSDCHFARISPLLPKSVENNELLKKIGFKPSLTHATDAELTVVIDLDQSEETILKSMRKTTRNSLRKAQDMGVVIKHSDDSSLFDDFKKVYLDTVERQRWNAYSVDFIKKEYEIFSKEKKADMFVAYLKDIPISASIFVKHRNQVIYHYSGSLTEYRDIPSAHLLHWEAIKYYKNNGFSLYNFWGVSPENDKKHPWYGLSLFKRGFSKKELEFVHSHDLIINPFAHLTRLYEYLETKKRGYR